MKTATAAAATFDLGGNKPKRPIRLIFNRIPSCPYRGGSANFNAVL